MTLERVDETTLSAAIVKRLGEIRACNNVSSVTVQAAFAGGVLVVIVPNDHVAEGGGWALPTEPHVMLIREPVN